MIKSPTQKQMRRNERSELRVRRSSRTTHIYDRHLVFDHVVSPEDASQRERFEAVARSLARPAHAALAADARRRTTRENPKRVYYLSMEFLIGRTLVNNIINLGVEQFVRDDLQSDPRQDWTGSDRDASRTPAWATAASDGWRPASSIRWPRCRSRRWATACATNTAFFGRRSRTASRSNTRTTGWLSPIRGKWLGRGETVQVPLGCSFQLENGVLRARARPHRLSCSACPTTVRWSVTAARRSTRCGCGERPRPTSSTSASSAPATSSARSWTASLAETVTRVLYPDDSTVAGQALRFVQEYFLVCCSLADIVARFRRTNADWRALPDKVAIQLNDTHPAMAVAELMRILLDQAKLGWDEAWDLTVRTLAYTNHTLLPEALEKWPVGFFELVCPRLLEIVYEINRRFLDDVQQRYPGDEDRVRRMSLIEETPDRQVRMANLAIVGTHSTNGVAQIHSDLLRTRVVCRFRGDVPRAIQQQDQRRDAAPLAAAGQPGTCPRLITEAIGDGWVTDLSQLRRLLPLADDAAFRGRFRQAKQAAKERFADLAQGHDRAGGRPARRSSTARSSAFTSTSGSCSTCCTSSCSTTGCEPIPALTMPPRTFFFAGKAAPAYRLAKLIIKLINNVGRVIDADPATRGRIKVVFLPNYNVSLAERLIPASDVSEQISTAGYEASGTGNMKFMMNGALTIGTRDGATIEMAEEAGEENFFLFGLTAEQVAEQPRLVQPALALRERTGDAGGARSDLQRSLQPRRAGHLRADPRDAAGARRLLHAPGRPDVLRPGPAATRRVVRRSGRLGAQGDHQRGLLRKVLQRPHDRRVRRGNLECGAVPGRLNETGLLPTAPTATKGWQSEAIRSHEE